jgi:carbon storage regulator
MLVLSRKLNETIVIGDGLIVIRVLEWRGDKFRIGIDAPRDIPVHRGEVHEAIHHGNALPPAPRASGAAAAMTPGGE